jgi:hypothetical protein
MQYIEKNGNQLWQLASKKEIKQLTDISDIHSTRFRGGYSSKLSENSLTYGFDVKYDLRHKARLVVGVNWTVNDKVDIYSGVVHRDIVRIGFFLGEKCLLLWKNKREGLYNCWV